MPVWVVLGGSWCWTWLEIDCWRCWKMWNFWSGKVSFVFFFPKESALKIFFSSSSTKLVSCLNEDHYILWDLISIHPCDQQDQHQLQEETGWAQAPLVLLLIPSHIQAVSPPMDADAQTQLHQPYQHSVTLDLPYPTTIKTKTITAVHLLTILHYHPYYLR